MDYFKSQCVPLASLGLWSVQCFLQSLVILSAGVGISKGAIADTSQSVIPGPQAIPVTAVKTAQASRPRTLNQGEQISVNGRLWQVRWNQWQSGSEGARQLRTGILETGLIQSIGLELLNSGDSTVQPVRWFSQPQTQPLALSTQLVPQYRYLDISKLAQQFGWQVQVDGSTLKITTPPAKLLNLRQGVRSTGSRLVIDLDRPTPWQIQQQNQQVLLSLDAEATPELIQQLQPTPGNLVRAALQHTPAPQIETVAGKTLVRVDIPAGLRPIVSTLPNPSRVILDLGVEAFPARSIAWAPGIRWQQQTVSLGADRFPVILLAVNLRQPGLSLKPIWTNPPSLVGTAPLISIAQRWQVAAAINGGFFNRENQLPLGGIRQDQRWVSGPILNRGAIAWSQTGDILLDRLNWREAIITSAGNRLPVLVLNSGYVQAGLSRYSPDWGPSYTPILDNEILVAVQNNQVVAQAPGGAAGQTSFAIPPDGYLLVLRSNRSVAESLAIGTTLRLESMPDPIDFARYPQVVGAGPLLLKDRQIVLDAKAEKFSDAFSRERAIRSAIAKTSEGNLAIVTVQNRLNGPGPSLDELARILQQLGAVDALNLDGGSSTTLYLGNQLLNRSPATAARVHNGIGIFIQPP